MRRQFIAEVIGTFLLVLIGTGAVATSTLTDARAGLLHVAAIWGLGIALAIYVTAAISGAHLNPAVSLAFALFRRAKFPFTHMLFYWAAQLVGAALAGLAILCAFGTVIARFEEEREIVRGEAGSERTAMVFGQYFPNPDMFPPPTHGDLISPAGAAVIEGLGTAILVLVIFSLADQRVAGLAHRGLEPLLIGFTVAVLIGVFAPLTQAGWNPARDLGPRMVAYFAGWGSIAIPGPSSGFWIYVVGPLVGGPVGALVHDFTLRPRRHLGESVQAEEAEGDVAGALESSE